MMENKIMKEKGLIKVFFMFIILLVIFLVLVFVWFVVS